ncbi:hypothetical protein [Stenotrophomonas bentonitica]|jgi:hypothetical protein
MQRWLLWCVSMLPFAVAAEPAWQVSVVPYAWGADVHGDAKVNGLPPVSVDKDFGETLRDLDMAGMAVIDVRRGRWGLLSDMTWVDTSESARVPQLGVDAGLETRIATGAAMAQYRFIDDPVLRMDVVAGARYWHLRGRVTALGRQERVSHDWLDPVLGVRMTWALSERQGINLWALGSASDTVGLDLLASYGVRISEHGWLRLGYRYLSLRQVTRYLDFDLVMSGPGLGLEWRY